MKLKNAKQLFAAVIIMTVIILACGAVTAKVAPQVRSCMLLFAALFSAVGIAVCALSLCKKIKIETAVLITVLMLGILFATVFPPFSVPDEKVHYATAYSYSNKLMLDFSDESNFVTMRSEDCQLVYSADVHISGKNIVIAKDNFSFFAKSTDKEICSAEQCTLRFFAYLPSAVGITIGRLCGLGAYPVFYLARIFNAAFFAVLLFFAIREMPFNKGAIAVIGMLPMSLHLAGGCTYDVFTIGLTLIMFARLVRLIYSKGELPAKDFITTLIICLLAIPYKIVYFTVPLTALLIPKERFKNGRHRAICVTSIILIGLVGIAALQLPARLGRLTGAEEGVIKNTYTLPMLIKNPIGTVKLLFNTMCIADSWYYETMVGRLLGWLEFGLPSIYVVLFSLLMFISFVKKEDEPGTLKTGGRLLCLSCVALTVIATLLLLCIGHTPSTSPYIQGVQGRYFIPILPLVMLAVRNNTLVFKKDIDKYLVLTGGLLNILVLLRVCMGMFA